MSTSFTNHANTQLPTHLALLSAGAAQKYNPARIESIKTAPIFTVAAGKAVDADPTLPGFTEFALLGQELETFDSTNMHSGPPRDDPDRRVFINANAPQSACICGVQGSGKSNTLGCILENFLIPSAEIGELPAPLRGLVFHYDQHESAPCEAAYLASHLPVTVLVPPSSLKRSRALYATLPGAQKKLQVRALRLKEKDLNVDRMLALMAVDRSDDKPPLYLEIVRKILRSMANTESAAGFDYSGFRRNLARENFSVGQTGPLNLRLEILESFMAVSKEEMMQDLWDAAPGSLVVVDLSDPFIDEATACLLFEICFTLFLSRPIGNGTVVALDEAHKYMTATPAAERFTDSLLRAIRLQRHQGARVLISTQEPTISANLLSLCTFTLTHRFTSPAWLRFLKLHIAPASQEDPRDLMQKIVELDCGEALLFASNGLMVAPVRKMNGDVTDGIDLAGLEIGHGEEEEGVESRLREEEGAAGGEVEKFGMRYLKIKIRKRLTADGGQSVMAVR